jgi:hypothetical protein
MKTRKTLSTFLIAWTLFFGQVTVTVASDERGRDPEVYVDHGRHEHSCTQVNGMGLELPGITDLVTRNHSDNCSVAKALEAGKDAAGGHDSVGFCLEVEKMKNTAESGCIIPTMDPGSIRGAIERLRNPANGLNLRDQEIEAKAKALRKHAEELNATAALQFGLSTDIKAVEHLFKMIWQEGQNPARKELFKNLFDLGDDFFSGNSPEASGYSVEKFISKAFQCLPYDTANLNGSGEGYETGIKAAAPSCTEAHLPSGSQDMLEAAQAKMMEECNNQGEECFFSGALDSGSLFNELHQAIASKIGGQGNLYEGNPAFLAENLGGLQHLGDVHAMLGYISRDDHPTPMSDGLQNILEEAKGRTANAWDPAQGEPPAEVVSSMRTEAFNGSVRIVLSKAEGLQGDSPEAVAKRTRFNEFLEKLKKDGHLENRDYDMTYLAEQYMVHFPNAEFQPSDHEVMGYILMVATGQKHADNMIQREIQMARTVSMVMDNEHESAHSGTTTRRGRRTGRRGPAGATVSKYRELRGRVSGLLERTRENPSTDLRSVQRELGRIFGADNARSGLWAAMTRFEGLKDNSESEAQALAFGARGVMSVMGNALRAVRKDEEKNGGTAGWSDEHKIKLIQLETLKTMAMRSAQTCNKLKQPSYKQGKFCSPLQDPDYANEALSQFIQKGFIEKGGNLDINQEKNLLSSALVYCAPILNAHEDRNMVQGRHYDPLSPQYAMAKFNQCQSRTRTLFCSSSGSACDLNNETMEQQQIALFGQTCNAGSLNSQDHTTRVGASLVTGILDGRSGDVTRPSIESGEVSINETLNMEVSKKEGDSMTKVARRSMGATYGYSNKSGLGDTSRRTVAASGGIVNDKLPDTFRSPMDAKVVTPKTMTVDSGAIPVDTSGETFVPVETINKDMADRVLETMTEPEEKESELAKLLERLSSLEEQLAKSDSGDAGSGNKDASLTALENEIKELRDKLARSSELKEKLAEIPAKPKAVETPTEFDPNAFRNDSRVVRNNTAGRSIASVNTAGSTTGAPVSNNIPGGGQATGFVGGGTVLRDGGDFSPSSNTAYFDGSEISLTRTDLKGVRTGSLIKLESNGELRHDDVLRFVANAAKGLEVGDNTRYVVTTADGQILVYTPKMINGQIEVEVSEYDPSQGGLDIAALETVQVETTAEDLEAGALRAPASDEPAERVYRNLELDCVLDGSCLETGTDLPTPLIQN